MGISLSMTGNQFAVLSSCDLNVPLNAMSMSDCLKAQMADPVILLLGVLNTAYIMSCWLPLPLIKDLKLPLPISDVDSVKNTKILLSLMNFFATCK